MGHVALPRRLHHAAIASAGKVRAVLRHAFLCLTLLLGAEVAGAQNYRLVPIAEDLNWPWSVARLPDGGFLIAERVGRLLQLGADGERREIAGTPVTLFAGQGGYFDVLPDPGFADNRIIYLSYAEGTEEANGTAVYRARLENGRLENGERILRVSPDKITPQHYGGRMLFLPDRSLLVTSGEGFEQREEAQSRESELGKVLRIETDGRPAGISSRRDGQPTRIWTLGHRNPQGLVRLPDSGEVFLHEHGPRGGDELNLLLGGENYGWPAVSHGVDYSGAYVTPFKSAPGMQDPLWTWVPSIAPSGMAWYEGSEFPEWRNSLLIGALVDREVRRLQFYEGEIVREEALFSELGERIRDVRVFDNTIYVLTDGERGTLYEVRRRSPP